MRKAYLSCECNGNSPDRNSASGGIQTSYCYGAGKIRKLAMPEIKKYHIEELISKLKQQGINSFEFKNLPEDRKRDFTELCQLACNGSSIILYVTQDLKIRSLTKSFTWRALGVFILLPLTYLFTGKWESAALLTLVFHLIRMVLYYYHERLWERVSWGRGNNDNRIWLYLSLVLLVISFILTILIGLRG